MIYLILYNIRSAYNVGSIFRTADAAGVDKIYLTGFSPEPIDRFGRKRKDIQKSALGAEDTVAWEYVTRPGILIEKLKKEGVYVVGVEQSPEAVDYRTLNYKIPSSAHILPDLSQRGGAPCPAVAFGEGGRRAIFQQKNMRVWQNVVPRKEFHSIVYMFGNEVKGLSPQILKKCDIIVEIPMHGKKESLNVAVAVGVTLFGMLKN